jgi:signal transduction histidine kinase
MADGMNEDSGVSATSLGLSEVFRDCLPCGLLAVSPEGRIAWLNAAAARLLGAPVEAWTDRPLADLPAGLRDFLLRAPVTTEEEVRWEIPGRGRFLCQLCSLGEIPAAQPGLRWFTLHDLRPMDQVERELVRMDRLANIGTLAASVAHEIKNALVAVKTYVELAQSGEPAPELGQVALRELKRIETIVLQMLRFTGLPRQQTGQVRLREILEHALRLVQEPLRLKSIRLERRYQTEDDRVIGNEYQLEQAFVNLLINAIESMTSGGTLTLEVVRENPDEPAEALREGGRPPRLRVTVADTGSGIAPEDLPRVFEPFFTTKRDGTGLGLAITRRIFEEHQAAISVESRLHHGTAFHILFPPAAQT